MNNQTITSTIISQEFHISIGHLASIFSLLLILLLILLTLFFLFNKQKNQSPINEQDLPSGLSTSYNEYRTFSFRRSRQYSSTTTTAGQNNPSINSFAMDIDDQNTRSTMNLLSKK